MANFMGPMAPPQAAPPQPQKLDIRTSPNQRQQFKDFMRQRTAMMPMTSAPVAPPPMMPMMPPQMPLRMEMGGDVDIFEPQNYHDGGVVSSLNRLQDLATMGSAFSEQLQSTVMGEGAGGMGMTGGFGGPSLSGPGPLGSISPPPGADVSNFFSNLRGQLPNQGLKIADRSGTGINNPDPAPTLNSSKPDNTRLLGSGDNIDQGFLNSPEFKNLDFTGPATQDMYNSPYFGTVMSGSQGKAQDAAYEAYLERIGNKAPAGTPTAPMQPARNLFSGTIEPTSYGLAGMGTTFSFEDGGAVPPRNVDIKGQPHMLSYITPDEADILEALGGSGEIGPMGIPSFPPSERDSLGRDTGQGREGGGGGADDRDGPDFGMSPGQSQAQFGTTEFAGMSEQDAKDTLAGGGGTDIAKAVQDNLAAQAAAEAARARAAEARARQDAINRARDRLEAGISATAGIGQRPDVNIGKKSQTEIDQDRLVDIAFMGTGQSPTDISGIPGIAAVDTTQPDDLVESNQSLLGDDVLMDDLLGIQSTTTPTTVNPNQVNIGIGSTTPITDLTADPMAVARGMDQVGQKGIADLSFIDAAADLITGILGIGPDPEQIRSDYENRAYSTLGMSPGTAEAVLGTQTKTGPVTGSIGGPRGFLGSLAFGPFSPGAAGMTGMTPDGVSTGAITGDQLFEAQDKGLFGDLTLGAASSSNVAVVDPNTGNIVGAIDGRGRYTGSPEFNPNTYGKELGPDAGGRDMPVVKSPTDPCPDGFVLKDGVCTPIAPTGDSGGSLGNIPTSPPPAPVSPVLVPSTRQTIPNTLQGPVGYGMPTAGQINPFAVSSAAQYQQMLNQQAMNPPQFAPIKFQDGGPVSPELDRAADNFLQSLIPAA